MWKKKSLFTIIFFTSLFLFSLTAKKILEEIKLSVKNIHLLINTTEEERKNIYYGYCNNLGYGYIKEIVSKIPEKGIIPEVRYKDYQKFVELFLPLGQYKKDDRLKIGINLSNNDIKETTIATASLVKAPNEGKNEETIWKFNTENDYDTMTGIKLFIEKEGNVKPLTGKIKITLYSSIYDNKPLNYWVVENTFIKPIIIYPLPKPVINFSYNRGCIDFILKIECIPKNIKINKVEILGIKVDFKDYKIINRKEKCFTAINKVFYKKITEENIKPWIFFLKEVTNVGDN